MLSVRVGMLWKRSPSAATLALAGLLAIVQAVLFATLIASQRNAAHTIDVSGLQRMQSQRIAFLTLALHEHRAPAGWRSELDHALETTLAVRRELAHDSSLGSPRGADGRTSLERMADRYISAAHRLEARPYDEAAYATIEADRLPLLLGYNAAVKTRVVSLTHRNDGLVLAMTVGLLAQLVIIVLSWVRVSAPAERRISNMLTAITVQKENMQSVFDENPDAIAVYDEKGNLVRINRARAALGGHGLTDQLGRHYTTFVPATATGARPNAFERAQRGETVSSELHFRNMAGEFVDTKMTFFPNIISGRQNGVIVVSRDVRALKAAERLYAEQSERLADLYAIAAAHGKSMRQRLADALDLAARHLGYRWAAATEISGGKSNVVATFGDPAGASIGAYEGLHRTIVGHVVNAQDIWSVDDMAGFPWLRGATGETWKSMTGMRIEADGTVYGVVAFASNTVRTQPLSDADRHFLRLVTALLGSIIERDQRERKLDSLAFFDALTGLPNRVLLLDRLEELMSAARHRNMHFALHYIDLDRFKAVNDDFGHGAGDAVLRAVATRLQQCARETDTVARLSGDEFVVLQSKSDGAEDFARRIVKILGEPILIKDHVHQIGASVGIALFPDDADSGLELMAAADRALYHAKRSGRSRYAFVCDLPVEPVADVAVGSSELLPSLVTPIRAKARRGRPG